ncbi:hypothetical protein LTS18_006283 [Coniosporium uncinatum]|uniref:Uncharacterized protein n=1 Tax=Coniosporium uncinatum TaxID=93489 RepID=A0ACC3DQA6_9PEZI|nr:hypothetical protein LTS18_006283 [Coniosporium uncinatum]
MSTERRNARLLTAVPAQKEGFVCANCSSKLNAATNYGRSVSVHSEVSSEGSVVSCATNDGPQPLFESFDDDFLVGLFNSTSISKSVDPSKKEVLCEQMSVLSHSINRRIRTDGPLRPSSPIVAMADRLSEVAYELWTNYDINFDTMAELRFAQSVLTRYEACVHDFHHNHKPQAPHAHTHRRHRHRPLYRGIESSAAIRHNNWVKAHAKIGAELEAILQQRKEHDADDPTSKARFQRAVAEETARFKVGQQLVNILHMYKSNPTLNARLERAVAEEAVREKVGQELQSIRQAYESTGKMKQLVEEYEDDPEACVYYEYDSDEE